MCSRLQDSGVTFWQLSVLHVNDQIREVHRSVGGNATGTRVISVLMWARSKMKSGVVNITADVSACYSAFAVKIPCKSCKWWQTGWRCQLPTLFSKLFLDTGSRGLQYALIRGVRCIYSPVTRGANKTCEVTLLATWPLVGNVCNCTSRRRSRCTSRDMKERLHGNSPCYASALDIHWDFMQV